MTAEEVKGLFDIQGGGCMQGTRYRPAKFEGGVDLPMNGSPAALGQWVEKQNLHGLGRMVEETGSDKLKNSAQQLRKLDEDTQAHVRQFAVGPCGSDNLVTAWRNRPQPGACCQAKGSGCQEASLGVPGLNALCPALRV